jgi:cytochrome d ubiquinol oxidase subunit II
MIGAIGPVWDANEVWLIVAGGATFAAFPEWYATLFSGFYLALFLILAALIFRAVAFEFRGRSDNPRWRGWWDRAIFAGSLVPAVLWGVAFANFVNGVPIDRSHEYTGTPLDLLNPYALLGGLTTLSLFTLHGSLFLTLKTEGELRDRARAVAGAVWWVALAALFAFLTWSYVNAVLRSDRGIVPDVVPLAALGAVVAAGWFRRESWELSAFLASGLSIVLLLATIFLNLYPRVLISSTDPSFSLTIQNASSSPYTLTVMTVVALVFAPLVLLYQGWTYWVFRRRISRSDLQAACAGGSGGFSLSAPREPTCPSRSRWRRPTRCSWSRRPRCSRTSWLAPSWGGGTWPGWRCRWPSSRSRSWAVESWSG